LFCKKVTSERKLNWKGRKDGYKDIQQTFGFEAGDNYGCLLAQGTRTCAQGGDSISMGGAK
jgi:GGDEF domain-containing protein